jgi:hypothetical protein
LRVDGSSFASNVATLAAQLSFLGGGPVQFDNTTIAMDAGHSEVLKPLL